MRRSDGVAPARVPARRGAARLARPVNALAAAAVDLAARRSAADIRTELIEAILGAPETPHSAAA